MLLSLSLHATKYLVIQNIKIGLDKKDLRTDLEPECSINKIDMLGFLRGWKLSGSDPYFSSLRFDKWQVS